MDYRKLFAPVKKLYVPSGWTIYKNHVFYIHAAGFHAIENENDVFLAREYFIGASIFYATSENNKLKAVVDMGCNVVDEDSFLLNYDINLWIYEKKSKKTVLTYELTQKANNADDAILKVSEFMQEFSHEY